MKAWQPKSHTISPTSSFPFHVHSVSANGWAIPQLCSWEQLMQETCSQRWGCRTLCLPQIWCCGESELVNSSGSGNIIPATGWRFSCFQWPFPCWLLFVWWLLFASTLSEVPLLKVLFFSTSIPVFLTGISRGRIWPNQNVSCWLRMASGGLQSLLFCLKRKYFAFCSTWTFQHQSFALTCHTVKVLSLQRSSFKPSDFTEVTPVPRRSFGPLSRPGNFLVKLSKASLSC